jgi:hypothetical protein
MHAYSTAEWDSLFLAEAGASAALAGLLFVALSINLERILKGAGLPGRAGEAIMLLLAVLVVATWALVPGQSSTVLGAELLGSGLAVWLIVVGIHVQAVRGHVAPSRSLLVRRILLAHAAFLPIMICCVWLLFRAGGGIYWLVPGILLCLLVAVLDAWVLLVEILR